MLVSGLRTRFPYPLDRRVEESSGAPRGSHPMFEVSERHARFPHAGLWLDKFLVSQEEKDETAETQRRAVPPAQTPKEDESSRAKLVREVSALPISPVYGQFYQEWKRTLLLYGADMREAHARGRVIVGLGAESVLETSIALHRTYGVPYIPGSALKGLAASYLRAQFGEKWREDETKRQQYKIIFGDTDEAGFIIFFDAFFIVDEKDPGGPLYRDIITVHHPDYYKGQAKPPQDTDNPNPVSFLSTSGSFLIALAAPDLQEARKTWLDATFDLLNRALQHRGIGAKTSSGYGRMVIGSEKAGMEGPASEEQQEEPVPPLSAEAQQCLQAIRGIAKPAFNQAIFDSYKAWKNLKGLDDRVFIAGVIIKRIREEGYEPAKAKKDWYKELVAFVTAEAGRKREG